MMHRIALSIVRATAQILMTKLLGKPAGQRQLPLAALFLSTAVMTGCAVGPDFKSPAVPVVDGYTAQPLPTQTASADVAGGQAQRFVHDMDIPGQWWTLFRSKGLNDLIEQALKNNPDVAAAQAALRGAQENVHATQGAYFPSVSASLNPTRQKIATPLASPAASGDYYYNLHTAQVSVAYSPDVFGGTRRQVESVAAEAEAQRFQLEATYLTLTSNVVTAAVQEASLRGQIAAIGEVISIQTKALELLQRQLALGHVSNADVAAQEAVLAQAQAMLPPMEKQLVQQRDLMARLVGRFPSEKLLQEFDVLSLQLPEALPVSVPSRLVAQRPDVRAAEAQLHAASAGIGMAIANRLPNVTLSANFGDSAEVINGLFTSGVGFWMLAANITQPIFQGGTLLHRQRAAVAAFDQAAAQYRGTVLSAFQNVADTLQALKSDANALNATLAAERAANKSLTIVRHQLELGDISNLTLLNAQQIYQQARISLVQAQANRYADTAALFQALGGGWWNRADTGETRSD